MKVKRALVIELNSLTKEQEIILGHLTYHAGKLWNQANYLVKNKLTKPAYRELYNKLKDKSIHLCTIQSRSAQIVLDELSRGWNNFFKFLKDPKRYKKTRNRDCQTTKIRKPSNTPQSSNLGQDKI